MTSKKSWMPRPGQKVAGDLGLLCRQTCFVSAPETIPTSKTRRAPCRCGILTLPNELTLQLPAGECPSKGFKAGILTVWMLLWLLLLLDTTGRCCSTWKAMGMPQTTSKSCRASRLTDILCLQSVAAEPTSVGIRVSRD